MNLEYMGDVKYGLKVLKKRIVDNFDFYSEMKAKRV